MSKPEKRESSEEPEKFREKIEKNASKKSPPIIESKPIPVSRKRKLSTSKNEPKAKKVKRTSNAGSTLASGGSASASRSATPTPTSANSSSSAAAGGTPKKYASEPHAKFRKKIEKKLVEVKMAEDGTHNPDRLLYHIRNNQPVANGKIFLKK